MRDMADLLVLDYLFSQADRFSGGNFSYVPYVYFQEEGKVKKEKESKVKDGEVTLPAGALSFTIKKNKIIDTDCGLINGTMCAVIMGTIAALWFHDHNLGLVIGAAMVTNIFVAGLAGTLIPIGMSRMKFDPAISSGVFLTTVTDIVGFASFLGLATIFLLK